MKYLVKSIFALIKLNKSQIASEHFIFIFVSFNGSFQSDRGVLASIEIISRWVCRVYICVCVCAYFSTFKI